MTLELNDKNFSIRQIANSGQCFRIDNIEGNIFQVIAYNEKLYIEEIDKYTHIFHCNSEEYDNIWSEYFDMNRNYDNIKQNIRQTNDEYLINAIDYGYGIRILKQDVFEMIISYIISQQNNISRIKGIIKKLCEPYDDVFPGPEILSKYSIEDFKNLGTGYRAEYLFEISDAIFNNEFDINFLKTLSYQESIKYLMNFKGIGLKVANCIALYGLNHIDAFPIDVWMKRIIDKYYDGKFDISRFEGYQGIVQQYMFFYERSKSKRS